MTASRSKSTLHGEGEGNRLPLPHRFATLESWSFASNGVPKLELGNEKQLELGNEKQ